MPWPQFMKRKTPARTAGRAEGDDEEEDDEEWTAGTSSPMGRWLSATRYAVCGPRAACACTTWTMALAFAAGGLFLLTLLVLPAPAAAGQAGAAQRALEAAQPNALVGPPACALLAGGGLYAPSLRHRGALHALLTFGFLHASIFHLLVSVCTLVRYGLPFERRRGWPTLVVLFFAAGLVGGLAGGAAMPAAVLAGGSSGGLALAGDELVQVLWTGKCVRLFEGGSRRKRALPLRLVVLGSFLAAHAAVLVFFSGGAISMWACVTSFVMGMLISMSASPSARARRARLDHGEGTGDRWAWWLRSGHLVSVGGAVLLAVVAVMGFETANVSDHAAC